MELGEFLERMRDAGITSGIHISLRGRFADYIVRDITEDKLTIGDKTEYASNWTYPLNPRNNLLQSPVLSVTLLDNAPLQRRVVKARGYSTVVTVGDL